MKISGSLQFIIGTSIMIGSIFLLISALAFTSWIGFIPAIGSIPIFFIGLIIGVKGADNMPDKQQNFTGVKQ